MLDRRRTVAWVLALVLPFQALTALFLDMRGPAHFHLELDDADHEHAHSHAQTGVAHHDHYANDHSVVAVHEHGVPDSAALEEETRSGWSGSMFAALVGSEARQQPRMVSRATRPLRKFPPPIPFLGRLERPPRIEQA